jgi:hypothetical protein
MADVGHLSELWPMVLAIVEDASTRGWLLS